LPVHLYLGTQFKIYATPSNGIHIDQLEDSIKKISDERCDYEPNKNPTLPAKPMCVERGGRLYEKIYFLVDKFWSFKASDGIRNNYVPPV
jgi:hypothetical protein